MGNSDTIEDFDLVDEIRTLIATAIEPINIRLTIIEARLTTIETNINLIVEDLQPMHQRLASVEIRQQRRDTLTPIPRVSSR